MVHVQQTNTLLLSIATFIYVGAMFLYLFGLVFKKKFLDISGFVVLVAGFLVETAGLIDRWIESYHLNYGHIPITNLYESLIFLSWTIALTYIIVDIKYKIRKLGFPVSLVAFIFMAYASFSPDVNSRIEPLVPALKSNWLVFHVITSFFGYAFFALAFGASVFYLISDWYTGYTNGKVISYLPSTKVLDDISYKLIIVGEILLAIGIITGAAWADYAWGRYWSWDPKETWSLITFLVYIVYIHLRYSWGWHGRAAAIFSIIGFAFVLFTYLGVNLILSGLHSYGSA
ncbi:MAG: c-type cytochrome biogenesis protein CcsB [bacterium]